MKLTDPQVIDALKARPGTTITSGGQVIPYPFPSPAEWRDQWIYFLLVDRFNNPNHPPIPDEYPCDKYQGGNFEGIRQQLPYLKSLGAGAIWLSPVLMNPGWFENYWGGYGTLDFLRIEPRFCSDPAAAGLNPEIADKEFRRLVDEAHGHGLYVILDIVLNHVGDLFNYEGMRDTAPWKEGGPYTVYWRDSQGLPRGAWTDIAAVSGLPADAGIWPEELQCNEFFRRQGEGSPDPEKGDFSRLKELSTDYQITGTNIRPVRSHLIRAYQYLMARFDLDGFRIDTLQYIEPEFARTFGNAIREYALSIGKKNFFTFGEVWQDSDESRIAAFIGRNTEKEEELIGIDAAIDFPLRKRLTDIIRGWSAPQELARHFDFRREVLKKIVSSHGDAGGHYITFLDNHDLNERFHAGCLPDQTRLALSCLMTLQGIPCLYYGTEQGLAGQGDRREYVRETLWNQPQAFSEQHIFYTHLRALSRLRMQEPALRYGRQYFRTCSGNGLDFGYSPYRGGVLTFSRILNDYEVLVVANTHTSMPARVFVMVDYNLNEDGKYWDVLFPASRTGNTIGPTLTQGNYRTVEISLAPMELLVLK